MVLGGREGGSVIANRVLGGGGLYKIYCQRTANGGGAVE